VEKLREQLSQAEVISVCHALFLMSLHFGVWWVRVCCLAALGPSHVIQYCSV
jgi:hypothetical protein